VALLFCGVTKNCSSTLGWCILTALAAQTASALWFGAIKIKYFALAAALLQRIW